MNVSNSFKPPRLGIIKGGQLGRMLIQEALNYDVRPFILDNDPDAPCKHYCEKFIEGDALDFDAVYNFGRMVDILTIEFEHVNTDALAKLEDEGLRVFPSAKTLRLIQDKGLQKQFYRENNIPTAEYHLINNRQDLNRYENFFPAVQKTCRAGYDGKGVYKIENIADLSNAFDEPSVLEKKVPIDKELAVIVGRDQKGNIQTFPVVELVFHPQYNLVDFLLAPARIEPSLTQQAYDIASTIAEKLNIVGVLAVEFFLDKDGKLLVNEIAPRTHNSGHHTIEANITSQFEQHLRAILGLPLGSTEIISPAVMINLLGEPGHNGEAKYEGLAQATTESNVFVHLYGKKYTKPSRKMGHVTILDSNLEKAQEKAILVQKTLKVIA